MGSAALLLGRPASHLKRQRREVVNDLDGFIVNFWRAVSADPDAVARYADNPKFESDLHARHYWLVQQRSALSERIEGDPEYYDAKVAGWWVWGLSNSIGGNWCNFRGPWHSVGGRLLRTDSSDGIRRILIHCSGDKGISRQTLTPRLHDLATRLEHVTVTCGDWTRVIQPSVCYSLRDTERTHITGVVLDPPYDQTEREANVYRYETPVSADVRAWALANGDNPLMRIVLFGYDGEHEMPDTWRAVRWKSNGGYANCFNGRGRENAHQETIWYSPHCIRPDAAQQLTLFNDAAD